MPTVEWEISLPTIVTVIGALVLILGGGFVVWKVVNPIAKKANRISELLLGRKPDELDPVGIPSLAARFESNSEQIAALEKSTTQQIEALDSANSERLDAQNVQIAEIRAQVTPNHGTSAHDKITRSIGKVDAKVDALFAHLGIDPPDMTD